MAVLHYGGGCNRRLGHLAGEEVCQSQGRVELPDHSIQLSPHINALSQFGETCQLGHSNTGQEFRVPSARGIAHGAECVQHVCWWGHVEQVVLQWGPVGANEAVYHVVALMNAQTPRHIRTDFHNQKATQGQN